MTTLAWGGDVCVLNCISVVHFQNAILKTDNTHVGARCRVAKAVYLSTKTALNADQCFCIETLVSYIRTTLTHFCAFPDVSLMALLKNTSSA